MEFKNNSSLVMNNRFFVFSLIFAYLICFSGSIFFSLISFSLILFNFKKGGVNEV